MLEYQLPPVPLPDRDVYRFVSTMARHGKTNLRRLRKQVTIFCLSSIGFATILIIEVLVTYGLLSHLLEGTHLSILGMSFFFPFVSIAVFLLIHKDRIRSIEFGLRAFTALAVVLFIVGISFQLAMQMFFEAQGANTAAPTLENFSSAPTQAPPPSALEEVFSGAVASLSNVMLFLGYVGMMVVSVYLAHQCLLAMLNAYEFTVNANTQHRETLRLAREANEKLKAQRAAQAAHQQLIRTLPNDLPGRWAGQVHTAASAKLNRVDRELKKLRSGGGSLMDVFAAKAPTDQLEQIDERRAQVRAIRDTVRPHNILIAIGAMPAKEFDDV